MNRIDFYKRYWILIEEILDRQKVGKPRTIAKKELHIGIKEYFDIDSLTKVKEKEWPVLLIEIKVLMTEIYGWTLREPGERFSPDRISLRKLLEQRIVDLENMLFSEGKRRTWQVYSENRTMEDHISNIELRLELLFAHLGLVYNELPTVEKKEENDK